MPTTTKYYWISIFKKKNCLLGEEIFMKFDLKYWKLLSFLLLFLYKNIEICVNIGKKH